jgi:hypothetical protein
VHAIILKRGRGSGIFFEEMQNGAIWGHFKFSFNIESSTILMTLITEEGHLLIENFVNIFFVTSSSVSLHNLLDFYNLFCLCCIVMSLRSVTH